MTSMAVKAWLIYRAGDGTLRVNKQRPRLAWDEIAWTVVLNVPAPWGALVGNIEITLPDGPPPEVTVTEIIAPHA